MRILLIGGGSGGHITPLLAVAREIKRIDPEIELIGICEKGSKFVSLYQKDQNIDRVFQVRAGKYRRYGGIPLYKRLLDIRTQLLNVRDAFYLVEGYFESKKLLKQLKPDGMLVKGGFVAVPVGKAAARLGIPYITHDSDSSPGLANRIISGNARFNATGMPGELYNYAKEKVRYTGIPTRGSFKKVTPAERTSYRESLGLSRADTVVTVIGGSQGAQTLNEAMISLMPKLSKKHKNLGLVMVVGTAHEKSVRAELKKVLTSEDMQRVVIAGFVDDMYRYTGAADVVVTRASATSVAELSLQAMPIVMVPGQLADSHQHKNADYFERKGATLVARNADSDDLYQKLDRVLSNASLRSDLSRAFVAHAKPHAARELAELTLELAQSE